jgi:hypothetical protein
MHQRSPPLRRQLLTANAMRRGHIKAQTDPLRAQTTDGHSAAAIPLMSSSLLSFLFMTFSVLV